MTAPAASKAAIERALNAAKAAGLTITGFRVSRDGTISVETAPPAPLDESARTMPVSRPKQWAAQR